jgi:nitrite reductase/ring-hydroxylating ferredoxin subunit/uncharacterized membrane protein
MKSLTVAMSALVPIFGGCQTRSCLWHPTTIRAKCGYPVAMLNPERSLNRRLPDRLAGYRGIDPLSNAVQGVVQKVLAAAGPAVRNTLNGTWLGHPLHPLLTDVPIGAWTVTLALDTLTAIGRPSHERGADAALAIGIVGAGAAAISGYADWSDTADEPKRLGTIHALLNGSAMALYVGSFAARRGGRRDIGIALATAGYGLVSFAAYLGGELTFGMQLGVRHTAIPIDPEHRYVPVLDEDALAHDKLTRVELEGIPVVLLRTGTGIQALGAACTHRGAPLDEGTLEDGCVRCPWHGSLFAFEDGHVLEGPASFPQPRFEARVRSGKIELRPI